MQELLVGVLLLNPLLYAMCGEPDDSMCEQAASCWWHTVVMLAGRRPHSCQDIQHGMCCMSRSAAAPDVHLSSLLLH